MVYPVAERWFYRRVIDLEGRDLHSTTWATVRDALKTHQVVVLADTKRQMPSHPHGVKARSRGQGALRASAHLSISEKVISPVRWWSHSGKQWRKIAYCKLLKCHECVFHRAEVRNGRLSTSHTGSLSRASAQQSRIDRARPFGTPSPTWATSAGSSHYTC